VKVKSCSAKESTKKDPQLLSFNRMKDNEGIYSSPRYTTKFVVLKDPTAKNAVVLSYYNNELKVCNAEGWQGRSFARCDDEEVCFEIRKKGA